MIDQTLFKSNVIGKDGFRWWVGQVAPERVGFWQNAAGNNNPDAWGNRVKVRIMGYHPFSKKELPDKDLPWANIMLPSTAGTGAAAFGTTIKLRPGDVVVGFFLDGDEGQQPVILGSFGRTNAFKGGLPSESLGFAPFTGYSDSILPPNGTLDDKESNDADTNSLKSPRTLDQKSIDELNKGKKEGESLEISASSTLGINEQVADACEDNFIGNVSSSLDNLLSGIGESTDFLSDVATVTNKIQSLSNSAVSTMMESAYSKMIPEIQGGLQSLYDKVLPIAGPIAAVEAQKAQVSKIASLQGSLNCLPGKIVSGLNKTIRNMIESAVFEVVDTGTCITEQLAGSLLNGITNDISSALDAPLNAVSDILPKSYKIQDVIRSSSDSFKSIGGLVGCNQDNKKCVGKIKKFSIGYGPARSFDLQDTYDNVLKNMNIADTLGKDSGPITKPDCASKTFCGPPSVSFFGGDGIGGLGRVILGGIVDNTEGLSDVTADVSQTASIIGVEITDPGSSYFSTPPVISFEDPCKQGYGAIGRAIVDYDPKSPTYGQITGVNIISEGENYPSASTDDVINSNETPVGVIATEIIDGGSGYLDASADGYNLSIDNGKIISATPINNVSITEIPKIIVSSSTGKGALIKPIIGRLPLTPQGEIIQVIDCVGPETNQIVGYVNGKPYYGPYHLHPTRGVKMVGAVHTSTPHEIIYDTPEQSFSTNQVGTASTSTQTQITNQSIVTPTENMSNNNQSPPSTPPSTPPPSSPPSGGGGYGGGY